MSYVPFGVTNLSDYNRSYWPRMAKRLGEVADCVVHMSEGWVGPDDGSGVLPKDRVDRKEALLVHVKHREGHEKMLFQEFEHGQGGEIRWVGEVEEWDTKSFTSYVMQDVYV